MSSVGSSSSGDSSLGADVGDLALLNIKSLSLSVRLKVLEERDDVLEGFLGPSSVVVVEIFAHGFSSGSSGVSSEGDDSGMIETSLKVLDGLKEIKSSAGSGSLISVLVVNSQVIDSAHGSYNNIRISMKFNKKTR